MVLTATGKYYFADDATAAVAGATVSDVEVAEDGKTLSFTATFPATELLQSGYYSVGEIASRCGFNNINYFSTFIKKETGLSPLRYRDRLLGAKPPAERP